MKCLYNGKIILKDTILADKAILFDESIIDIIDLEKINTLEDMEMIDAKGQYISPGFVDVHVHGYEGEDASDGNYDGIQKISKGLAKNGVTSFLPTTMTLGMDVLGKAFGVIKKIRDEGSDGAEVLGAHAEGPFINVDKKGAQNANFVKKPDYKLIEPYKDVIKLITIAPEVEGAIEFIDEVKEKTDIVISMGHTNASYEEAMEGINHGISHVTHLFNAMTSLNHREPGAVGAALTSDVSCEIITDTIHIHPHLFSFVSKNKGVEKVVLITDCMRAGGLEEGEYDLGGQQVFVKNKKCVLENGTIAGSVLKLNEAVKNTKKHTDHTMPEVIRMASLNPATVIGVEDKKGSIEIGKDADFTIFDEEINIVRTIGKGKIIYDQSIN